MELCFDDSNKIKFHLIIGGGTLFWRKCDVNSWIIHILWVLTPLPCETAPTGIAGGVWKNRSRLPFPFRVRQLWEGRAVSPFYLCSSLAEALVENSRRVLQMFQF